MRTINFVPLFVFQFVVKMENKYKKMAEAKKVVCSHRHRIKWLEQKKKECTKQAKVEQNDTKWKWKNHHHNSKAVRKRFSIFFSLYIAHFASIADSLLSVPVSLTYSVRDFMAFHFSFFFLIFRSSLCTFGHPSFRFSVHNSNKSLCLNSYTCCIHFMLHMTKRHIQS